MSSSSGILQLGQRAFHLGMVVYYAAVNIRIVMDMEHAYEKLGRPKGDPEVKRMLDGSATYFTMWNLVMQELYFTLCCTEYLFEYFPKALSPNMQEQLRSFRKMYLPVFLFPSSCEVVYTYWSRYAYSPPQVFGDILDAINPMWINHAIHSNIVPIAILELLLRARTEGVWDGGQLNDTFKLFTLFTAYLATVLVGRHRRGCWPYPFMDSMDMKEFWAFTCFCYIMGWIYLCLGRGLTRIFSVGMRAERPSPVSSKMKVR
ncbi:androgen-dependent TFPI-regulating protein-like [Ischnura elegans]|uniref:androgen-dependent TFPI-regulating protein-like n=1 Tax=Ischnura elegans TaxID=197161 RepID=UPI001ED8BA0D|nr:androgen-dependent TFPI-regulating protein-like [Ischnura elegans]